MGTVVNVLIDTYIIYFFLMICIFILGNLLSQTLYFRFLQGAVDTNGRTFKGKCYKVMLVLVE